MTTMPALENDLPFPFRRVVAVGASPEFDADLVHYGGVLASLGPETELIVLSRASRALQSFAVAPSSVLASRGPAIIERVSCRVVVEPDLDGLLAYVDGLDADLLLVRLPRSHKRARQAVRRLAMESLCSVCLVPNPSPAYPSRVVAGMDSDEAAAALLRAAAAICKSAGSSELVAVRTWLDWTMDPSEAALDRLREREWLNLFRFLERVDLDGVDCTPRVEESAQFSNGVLRVALERQADLIVVAAPERSYAWLPGPCPRQEDLMLRSPVPLLLLRSLQSKPGLRNVIRRMFPASEPTFG